MADKCGKQSLPAPLARDFHDRPVEVVARELLGKLVVRELDGHWLVGRIVEAEAYLAEGDTACHSHRGRTRRNASMFGPPGHAYVYAIHSRWCLNAVTEATGVASAVLIRALEPLEGIEVMRDRRGIDKLRDIARGPARLCEALGIDRELDGWDLTRGERLWIAGAPVGGAPLEVITTPRIGVTSAHELPLRFALADCPYVSGARRLRTDTRTPRG